MKNIKDLPEIQEIERVIKSYILIGTEVHSYEHILQTLHNTIELLQKRMDEESKYSDLWDKFAEQEINLSETELRRWQDEADVRRTQTIVAKYDEWLKNNKNL